MAYEARFTAYSGSDWVGAIEVFNDDTGALLEDIDDALVEMRIRNDCNATILSGSTDDGHLTRPAAAQIRWLFPASEMSALCAGQTYGVGIRMTTSGGKVAILTGSVAFIDGEF